MMSREMVQTDVLSIPRLGFVGCHPGILPDYRGVYAPFWAMRDGRADKVGLTVYVANEFSYRFDKVVLDDADRPTSR